MEESQIGLARSAAEAGGHANAMFHVGSVTDLLLRTTLSTLLTATLFSCTFRTHGQRWPK